MLRRRGNGGTWFYNASLQRSFLKEDRLTVRLSADRFFSGKYSTFESRTTQGDYTGVNKANFLSRGFRLSISYRFGSLKARVKQTDKTIQNDDLVGGSKQGGGQGQQGGQGQMGN